jgi:hypothetical protein
VRVQIPLENELAVSVNVDMARAVVALPRQKDVVLSANLAHLEMLPPVVTDATWPGAGLEKGRLLAPPAVQTRGGQQIHNAFNALRHSGDAAIGAMRHGRHLAAWRRDGALGHASGGGSRQTPTAQSAALGAAIHTLQVAIRRRSVRKPSGLVARIVPEILEAYITQAVRRLGARPPIAKHGHL